MKASFGYFAACSLSFWNCAAFAADPPEPRFRAITIDDKVQIGYGLAIADVDGDGKPDIILADKKQIVWYKNPGGNLADAAPWQKYVIAENLTVHDDVCVAAQDIDGDGKCEIAVGAEWDPGDTEHSGAVFYLVPPADRTHRWEPVKLPDEPTVHRMRWLRLEDGKWVLVMVPLHGRGNKNGEGAGVHVIAYHPPAGDPHGEWKTDVIDSAMHMTHNFTREEKGTGFLLAGKEGLAEIQHSAAGWKETPLPFVPETAGAPFKGIGEIRIGHAPALFLAAVEPMHGNVLVCYSGSDAIGADTHGWTRHVLTDQLIEGHALACGDMLGLGSDQVVVGWRGNPQNPKPVGIHLWTPLDLAAGKWRDSAVDDGGIACEDLQVADLNGDGKLDIVGAGRASHNLKLYVNER